MTSICQVLKNSDEVFIGIELNFRVNLEKTEDFTVSSHSINDWVAQRLLMDAASPPTQVFLPGPAGTEVACVTSRSMNLEKEHASLSLPPCSLRYKCDY